MRDGAAGGRVLSLHRARVEWRCEGDFPSRRYSRAHTLSFDEGLVVPGTAAPSNVNPRYAARGALDPEQAFTAALSACHMLWFLDLAARAGFSIEEYRDDAEGTLGADASGARLMTRVVLRPRVAFVGAARPTVEELIALHERAHEACFIANSVKTEVIIEPRREPEAGRASARAGL
jgi:organic hydroperoxide reductase OsmC/OhrA